MGVATGGVWTGNLRALRHVLAVRVDAAAEEEIAYVFSLVLKRMIEEEATIFADFEQTDDGFWKPVYWKV
jgi:thymidylate synthase (FAD)